MHYAVAGSAALIIAVMLAINGELTAVCGETLTTLLIHLVGLGVCSAAALIKRENPFKAARDGVSRYSLPVGIAFAALGLFCLAAPRLVMSVVPLLCGIVLLIDGAGKLGRAFEFKRLGFANWGMLVWIAAVVLIFGLMMVTQPFAVLETVMRLFGAVMVADGLIELYMAAKIYKISKR